MKIGAIARLDATERCAFHGTSLDRTSSLTDVHFPFRVPEFRQELQFGCRNSSKNVLPTPETSKIMLRIAANMHSTLDQVHEHFKRSP